MTLQEKLERRRAADQLLLEEMRDQRRWTG
jgi:hypothetical protein